MPTMKEFKSDYALTLDGFWDPGETPDDTAPLVGVLADFVQKPGFNGNAGNSFFVMEIEEDTDAISRKVTNEETGEAEIVVGATKGMRVAFSNYAAFHGLERYKNHRVSVTFTGWKQLSNNRSQRVFKVEYSDSPVRAGSSRGGTSPRGLPPTRRGVNPNGSGSTSST